MRISAWLCIALAIVQVGRALAEETAGAKLAAAGDLKRLSLEQLIEVEVYSASRRPEPTQAAPNAIFVLTGEDLRRSRVTSIPEALRLVPGVEVGRVDANKWAVSMRGFNAREANKLLVLLDGRSIYDPLFSGMLWESQDFTLEDIDRIEVIRGPGGTLWGANAFNGVINIITKHARDTQGALASALAGDEERYTVATRYGWQPSDRQAARVYAKAFERDTGFSSPAPPHDESQSLRGGFRWDWSNGARDEVRVSGDIFDVKTGIRENPTLTQDVDHRGRNVLARWNRQLSPTNGLRLQLYYDRVVYESFGFDQERKTYDLEALQTVQAASRHLLVWGAGFRRMSDHANSGLSGFVDVLPLHREDDLVNVFAQDTIALAPDELHLVVGLKYEETDYADAEWLPNLRLAWTPDSGQTWWAAVSDAVRVPSRLESDLTFSNTIRIGDNFESEHVRAYELGQRWLVTSQLWYDVAVFYNDYDDLRTSEGGQLRNFMHGNTSGAELAVRWEPMSDWRLDLAYTYLRMELDLDAGSTADPGFPAFVQGLVSRHRVSLRSALDLPNNLELDATLRYVTELVSLGFDSYTELDLGLSWFPRPGVELSLVGQNLLDPQHPEQDFPYSASGMPTEVERSFYGRITWSF